MKQSINMEETIMKKITLLIVLLLGMFAFTGCKKESISMKSSNIEVNTMLVKKDGVVQVATVEEFNKEYYDVSELKQFIQKEITKYNTKVGNESAIVLDSLEVVKKNAIMILEYANMDTYVDFNEVEARYVSNVTQEVLHTFPETFQSVEEERTVSKESIALKEGQKAVCLNEEYEFRVNGKIKYFSGGVLVNNKIIQTGKDQQTIVIYE